LKITRVIISNILINGEVIYSTSYTAEKSQQWDPHVWGPYPLGLYADSQASNIFSKVDDCASGLHQGSRTKTRTLALFPPH
jgi:hypothetical protein